MKTAVSRLRAGHSMLGECLLGVFISSFTGGCVRELTDLTFEALPNDAATTIDAAVGSRDAEVFALSDAGVSDGAMPDGAMFEAPTLDADVQQEAAVSKPEAGVDGAQLLPTGSVDAAVTDAPDAGLADNEASSASASSTPGEHGESWVFQVAAPFETGDAGVGFVPVLPALELVVDGSTTEWSDAGWLWIATRDASIGEPRSEVDLSAALAVRWDTTKLFLAVAVSDQHHVNDASGFDIWGGDSIQVAFDVGQGRLPYDWEYGFAKTNRGLIAHRWRDGDADLSADMDFAVVRHTGVTVYEVAFEVRHLGIDAFPLDVLRLSVAVNDNDGQERRAALELVQGIVGTKSAERFASAEWK